MQHKKLVKLVHMLSWAPSHTMEGGYRCLSVAVIGAGVCWQVDCVQPCHLSATLSGVEWFLFFDPDARRLPDSVIVNQVS